ncbi:MAG: tyrosine-type recombinase/integrase [Gammaproteobacteria bacterium]|nr:tyrosine-type recombinase/integrase [Gammaproteobacteria bacterium]
MLDARQVNPFGLLAVQMLAYTGCRIKEVGTMKMEDIDVQNGTILLPEHKTDRVDPSPKVVEITPSIRTLVTK